MSEDEYWAGTAKIVRPHESEDLEALCKRVFEEKGFKKSEYQDSYAEALIEEARDKFAIAAGQLYDTSGMEESDGDYICEASRVDADTVKVTLRFYNGGTYFGEMFEEAVAKLNETATA